VALDALSGELHASAADSLLRQGDAFLATAIERQASAQEVMEGGRRIWVDAFGRFGSVDWDGNASGADYRSAGVAGGLDVEVTPATRLGLAVGYSRGSTDLDRTGGGEAETDSYHLGLYGEYEDGPWNLRAAGAYSWHDVETERQIRYGRVDRRAEADYDADQFSAYLRAAYSLQAADGSTVQPFASLAYSRLDRPGFRESGADSLNLEVDGETMESLVSTLGVRAIWDREWGKTRVRPELRVGWAHQFLDGFGELTAHLAGAPGRSGYRDFTVRGPQTGRDAMVVGAGLTAEIGKSSRLFLSYDALVNGDRTDQAVVGGIRVTW
jgi:outer membrane autotransporter protein